MRWRDRIIGIVLGVALGVGVVVAFVFLFSEQTVDAPSLSGSSPTGRNPGHADHRSGEPRVATVEIVGGAPPEAGPPQLHYQKGDTIRLKVVSDAAVAVRLTGYGVTRTVPGSGPTEIDVRASRAGSFALIVIGSHIAVAQITVGQ